MSQPARAELATRAPEYSPEERALVLETAHRAIAAAFADRQKVVLPATIPPHLSQPRGAFATLHLEGQLRGCVGYIAAVRPLLQTVAEAAVSAAFYDPRFPPLTPEEARRLKIEVSVLSLPAPILPEQVEAGRHGLIVTQAGRRGLLLPQVASEHGWDASTFLAQTCLKAGLPPDAWQKGAQLEAFTAEVFGEE
jgi:AmmeMemoRadiSam system protein A